VICIIVGPNIKNLNHNGVMVRCLILVKMYGNSPRKLLNMIKENGDINMRFLPFLSPLFPRSFFNSLRTSDIRNFYSNCVGRRNLSYSKRVG
jgi:hypothetical protein